MTITNLSDSAPQKDTHAEFSNQFTDEALEYQDDVKKNVGNLVGNVEDIKISMKKYIKYESEEELIVILEALEKKGYFINGADSDLNIKRQRNNSSFPIKGVICATPGLGLQYLDDSEKDTKALSAALSSKEVATTINEIPPYYKNPDNLKKWQEELEAR